MINIVAAVHLHPYRRLTDSGDPLLVVWKKQQHAGGKTFFRWPAHEQGMDRGCKNYISCC